MSLLVKLCGIRTEADLAAAVEAGAGAVGFVLTPSPRMVTVAEAAALAACLPRHVLAVAVFHDPDRALLVETERRLAPDLFQAEPSALEGVDPDRVLPVVVDRPGVGRALAGVLERHARALVDSAARGGTGRTPDWGRIATLAGRERVVLAGGLTPDNVAEAVRLVGPLGVDVSTGIEHRPGEKDPGLMRRFVAAAREAAESRGAVV